MEEIPADWLPSEVERNLNEELLPGNVLHKDIRDLAGILDFTLDEINYLCRQQSPFRFFLDQWCKREGKKATLEKLHEALVELGRPDLAEEIQKTIENLKESNFTELKPVAELQYERQTRREEDCTFVASSSTNNDEASQEGTGNEPYVYVVYYPENEQHVEGVVGLVNKLRRSGIDARAGVLESQIDSNRQFYVFSNLQKADYVLVVCSAAVKSAEKIKKLNQATLSEEMKEICFALNFIIGDIFRKRARNSKFIPVFLTEYRKSEIPQLLHTPKCYTLSEEFDSLVRRIFKVSEWELPGLVVKKTFQPKFVHSKT